MTSVEIAESLGFPWNELASASSELEEAKRESFTALEDGDTEAIRLSKFDLEVAREKVVIAEEHLADCFLILFQFACKHAHGALWEKAKAFVLDSVWHEEFKKWLTDRDTQSLKRENWELAKWCRELEQRLAAVESKVADGNQGTSSQPRSEHAATAAAR